MDLQLVVHSKELNIESQLGFVYSFKLKNGTGFLCIRFSVLILCIVIKLLLAHKFDKMILSHVDGN